MELAVIAGLEALNRPCDVKLYSDSKYVVDAFNHIEKKGWKRCNCRKAADEESPVFAGQDAG